MEAASMQVPCNNQSGEADDSVADMACSSGASSSSLGSGGACSTPRHAATRTTSSSLSESNATICTASPSSSGTLMSTGSSPASPSSSGTLMSTDSSPASPSSECTLRAPRRLPPLLLPPRALLPVPAHLSVLPSSDESSSEFGTYSEAASDSGASSPTTWVTPFVPELAEPLLPLTWHDSCTPCLGSPLAPEDTPLQCSADTAWCSDGTGPGIEWDACVPPSPKHIAITPEAANCAAPLLNLPDSILASLWEHLDRASRRAWYHSCRSIWSNPAVNARLVACVAHTRLDDLLSWPRHAPPPSQLRIINTNPSPGPLSAAAQPGDGEPLPCSFVRFFEEARLSPRARALLANLQTLILQGRGRDREVCRRLGVLLGSLCPGLRSLQLDWVSIGGDACGSLAAWLPELTHLSLTSVNSQDVAGNWPTTVLTYADIGSLSGLRNLEIIDSHLPFLELGVADITGLIGLSKLQSLHLIYSEREHAWPGSKPCYLLLGLEEVSRCCEQLTELVIDGVQLAKLVAPSWPRLTTLCLGFISGWHPALLNALQIDTAAPRLKRLSLGPVKCSVETAEARLLYGRRLQQACHSLAAVRCAPRHLELLVPQGFLASTGVLTTPTHLLTSLEPLGQPGHLTSLSIDSEGLLPGDARALATAAPHLTSLCLSLAPGRACGEALSELLDMLPKLEYVQLGNSCAGRLLTQMSEPVADGNVLALCYAAYSAPRTAPLTLVLRGISPFAASCLRELRALTPASGQPLEIVSTLALTVPSPPVDTP